MKRGSNKSMDLLRSALADRQAKANKVIAETGQKWIRRGIIEDQRKQEYLEDKKRAEEEQEAREEERLEALDKHIKTNEAKFADSVQSRVDPHAHVDLDDDDAEPPLSLSEVIERLRELEQPITLFGETDMIRFRRLRKLEKDPDQLKRDPNAIAMRQDDMLAIGQHAAQRQDELGAQSEEDDDDNKATAPAAAPEEESEDSEDDQKKDETSLDTQTASSSTGDGTAPPAAPEEEEVEPIDVDTELMDKCDFIRSWVRKVMKAWEQEVANRSDDEKKKAAYRVEVAQHRQARRDVRPLQKRCKVYAMDDMLLPKVHSIVSLAEQREYRDASEAYIDLSIGKAAWPVGLGCGGGVLMEDVILLHDKFNRMANVKDIAYLLNDETTRKYVQALKRLMRVAQKHFPPTDPSKCFGD